MCEVHKGYVPAGKLVAGGSCQCMATISNPVAGLSLALTSAILYHSGDDGYYTQDAYFSNY
jgi:hypothetical protein